MVTRWKQTLDRAEGKRKTLGFGEEAAFRLVDGQGDGVPDGLAIDVYAGRWLVLDPEPEPPPGLADELRRRGVDAWFKRVDAGASSMPQPLTGAAVPPPFLVREGEMSFEIRFDAGYSQGLFLDQRDNRAEVFRRVWKGRTGGRVLNLFSYTCAFSVAAARAGAQVTSVDLSAGYLDWGKENFRHNGLDPSDHYFLREDAGSALAFFRKRGFQFDGVVIDPPTFSRSKKSGVWRLEKDLPELVAAAANVLAPEGWMMVSANCRSLANFRFGKMVESGLSASGRDWEFHWPEMPKDFTGDPYLHCVWVDPRATPSPV